MCVRMRICLELKSLHVRTCKRTKEEDKSLLFDSDPWPPAEQKLEMPCDSIFSTPCDKDPVYNRTPVLRSLHWASLSFLCTKLGGTFYKIHSMYSL